jgi:hypothetical protein
MQTRIQHILCCTLPATVLCFIQVCCGGASGSSTSAQPSPPPPPTPTLEVTVQHQILKPNEIIPLNLIWNVNAALSIDFVTNGGNISVDPAGQYFYQAPASPGHFSLTYKIHGTNDPVKSLNFGVWQVQINTVGSLNSQSAWFGHCVTKMRDGRFLITGFSPLFSAEIYDPKTQSSVWTGRMVYPRTYHNSLLLPDGRILCSTGRLIGSVYSKTIEAFDPSTNTFSVIGDTYYDHYGRTASALLPNGNVAIISGDSGSGGENPTIEIFNPTLGGTAQVAATLNVGRSAPTATLLSDGTVLVAGGSAGFNVLSSTEVFDPNSGLVKNGPSMQVARANSNAITLQDGRVLMCDSGELGDDEIFDPNTDTFSGDLPLDLPAPPPADVPLNSQGIAVIHSSGAALSLAGFMKQGDNNYVELFDPQIGQYRNMGVLPVPRAGAQLVIGDDGLIYIIGGSNISDVPLINVLTIKVN